MFYDGKKLLAMKDLDNEQPEIYMSTGNRSSGKTTYFNRLLVEDFLRNGHEFMLIYRYSYELANVESAFFDGIKPLFFQAYDMDALSEARGMYKTLVLNDKVCGYAVTLNSADLIKRRAHEFNNVHHMLFDEFQSETSKYCEEEISKFMSLHMTVARGGGAFVRRVPVYMVSNCVSVLNPYFQALGVMDRLQSTTKFLRGNGWVLEQNFNTEAADALKSSRFMKAFENETQFGYATENVYLLDSKSFIGKVKGRGNYLATIKYGENYLSVSWHKDEQIFYCDRNYDKSFPVVFAADIQSHSEQTTLIKNSSLINHLRDGFHKGLFRFRDGICKQAILKILRY